MSEGTMHNAESNEVDWTDLLMGKGGNAMDAAAQKQRAIMAGLSAAPMRSPHGQGIAFEVGHLSPQAREALQRIANAPIDTRDDWSVKIGNSIYSAAEYAELEEHFAGVARARERALPEWMENHILVAFHRGEDAEKIDELINNLPEDAAKLQQLIGATAAESEGYEVADVVVADTLEGADGITSIDPTVQGPLANPLFSGWMSDAEKTARHTMHRPVIDIDFPAALIPSTTPGHYHLYLDKLMPTDDFVALMQTLADVGVVEQGYAYASIERGYSSVRLPWVRKEQS